MAKYSRALQDAGPPPSEQALDGWLRLAAPREESVQQLAAAAAPGLTRAIYEGLIAELTLHNVAVRRRAKRLAAQRKLTTAEEWALENLEPDELPEIPLEAPAWMRAKIRAELQEIFAQPYWQNIPQTTSDQIKQYLSQGLQEGWSTQRIAKEIVSTFGSSYSRTRAMMVARTESGAALNSGHVQGMRRLQEELGQPVGKEWVSVLGNTTRDTHAEADGQVVEGPDADFTVGGYQAPYPGHHSLPPGERINCACTIISALTMSELADDNVPEELPDDE